MASTILVKDIPQTILKEINKEQAAYKDYTGVILNQSKAVIKMLRDYIKCRERNNFKPDPE